MCCSLAPASFLSFLYGSLVVVLFVDLASAVGAVHGAALQAAVVLLLLHATTDVLLGARGRADEACRIGLCASVAVLAGARLVCLHQTLSAASAGVLLHERNLGLGWHGSLFGSCGRDLGN